MTKFGIKLHYLTAATALALASAAAYFSIFGLMALFAGAKVPIAIMGSFMEVAKIVAVSLLYTYYKDIQRIFKVYLIIAIVILMIITAVGVYGFLTNSYQQTSATLNITDTKTSINLSQQQTAQQKIDRYNQQLSLYQQRLSTLNDQRTNQEARLSEVTKTLNRRMIAGARSDIDLSTQEIAKTQKNIDDTLAKIDEQNNIILGLKEKEVGLKSEVKEIDVGPLKYLSRLLGVSMDKVVHYLTLGIILVFDPLAVMLVIATNLLIAKRKQQMIMQSRRKKTVGETGFDFKFKNEDELKAHVRQLKAVYKRDFKEQKSLTDGKS